MQNKKAKQKNVSGRIYNFLFYLFLKKKQNIFFYFISSLINERNTGIKKNKQIHIIFIIIIIIHVCHYN
jgi:hypothetical protein